MALYLEHRIPKLRNGYKAAQDIAQVVDWFAGRSVDDLAAVARDYAKDNPDLAPATVRNRMAYVRAACRYAWKYHKLGDRKSPPGIDMDLPAPDNQRQIYHSADELAKLWKCFDDESARALFQLAFYTGLRWREGIYKRTRDDIVNDGGLWLRVPTTKNKKPRMVPIIPEARPALAYIPFTNRADRWYYACFERARDAAKLSGSVAHDLRHSLASAILSGLGTLSDVGAALGHVSPQSSMRYAHMYPDHLRHILGKVGKKMPTTKRKAGTKK